MNQIQVKPVNAIVNRYTLLTGATGLVGQYLLRDLMCAGVRVAVVARPGRKESPAQRIERIMQRWESEMGRLLPRPVVFCGNVVEEGLGLSHDDRRWISNHCDRMIHNAAVLKFNGERPHQEPWLTNLLGTQNAVGLARDTQINNFHYVSTAYVCGKRQDLIRENEFDCGQSFRNDYERSKFEAEKFVRESGRFDTLTVYRPTVISGDSQTGYTSTYHGLYLYLRLFAMFVPQQKRDENGKLLTRMQLPLNGNEHRNIVPVDWVSQVLCELFCNPETHGQTFHLSPEIPLTPKGLIEDCYEYFDSCGVEFCGQGNRCHNVDQDFASSMMNNIAVYEDYETSDPLFDTSNLKRYAGHLHCPPIDRGVIHRYLNFGIENQWGKRKDAPVVVPEYNENLKMLTRMAREINLGIFGVRILGPGGGDWTIGSSVESKPWTVQRGWCGSNEQLIELQASELNGHTDSRQLSARLISLTGNQLPERVRQNANLLRSAS